jgi:hypothetical protein
MRNLTASGGVLDPRWNKNGALKSAPFFMFAKKVQELLTLSIGILVLATPNNFLLKNLNFSCLRQIH